MKFSQICEAYDVLSNNHNRHVYDKYGPTGLREGIHSIGGKPLGAYSFCGNPYEVFEKFFGNQNPFVESLYKHDQTDGSTEKYIPTPADVEVILECSLHEFYNGCMKKIEYDREILNLDNKTTKAVRESIEIHVKPGYSHETVLNF